MSLAVSFIVSKYNLRFQLTVCALVGNGRNVLFKIGFLAYSKRWIHYTFLRY